MDDTDARELLGLLYEYFREYGGGMKYISELASDLAQSLDVTTDEDDRMRRFIEETVSC